MSTYPITATPNRFNRFRSSLTVTPLPLVALRPLFFQILDSSPTSKLIYLLHNSTPPSSSCSFSILVTISVRLLNATTKRGLQKERPPSPLVKSEKKVIVISFHLFFFFLHCLICNFKFPAFLIVFLSPSLSYSLSLICFIPCYSAPHCCCFIFTFYFPCSFSFPPPVVLS